MASETTTTNSIKRRKTEQGVDTSLSDLPIGILEHTAGFLASPSRALFAVALSTNENNSPGENYSSIAGSDWETLDFGEIEKELAARLSDDDISHVLQHIDAVNEVKRLRLTNLTNITGDGLEPLRGSAVIEQIDLSLKATGEAARNPWINPEPSMSRDLVLPILDSIVAAIPCALKHLQFPRTWRRNYVADSEFHAFILRYNQMRRNQDTLMCSGCNSSLPTSIKWIDAEGEGVGYDDNGSYGLHCHTCYQCTNDYCHGCECGENTEEDGIVILGYCWACQRDYCKECVEISKCRVCDEIVCEDCKLFECKICNKNMCWRCIINDECHVCTLCGVAYCEGCKSEGEVQGCDTCNEACCNSCRRRMYHEAGGDSCAECIKDVPNGVFLELIMNSRQEVEQLKAENRELTSVNKELQAEIKELKNKQGKSMMTE